MENIAAARPNMAVLDQNKLMLSPFGALSHALAEEILARTGQAEGVYPFVPLELLREPEPEAETSGREQAVNVEVKLALELAKGSDEIIERTRTVERILEKIVRIREHTETRQGSPSRERETPPSGESRLFFQNINQHISFPMKLSVPESGEGAAMPGGLARISEKFASTLKTLREEGIYPQSVLEDRGTPIRPDTGDGVPGALVRDAGAGELKLDTSGSTVENADLAARAAGDIARRVGEKTAREIAGRLYELVRQENAAERKTAEATRPDAPANGESRAATSMDNDRGQGARAKIEAGRPSDTRRDEAGPQSYPKAGEVSGQGVERPSGIRDTAGENTAKATVIMTGAKEQLPEERGERPQEAVPIHGQSRPAAPEELTLAPVGSGLEQSSETAAPAAGREASDDTRRGARQPHSVDNVDKKSEARRPETADSAETVHSVTAHGKTVAGEAATGEAGRTAEGPETVGRAGRPGTAGGTEKSGTSGSTERAGTPGSVERREAAKDVQKAGVDASYEQPGSLRRTGSGAEYEESAKLGDSANRSDSAERGERPAEAIPLRGEVRPSAPEELIHSAPETATPDARSVTSPGHVAMHSETGAAEAIPIHGEVRPDAPEELVHSAPETAASDVRSVTRPEHVAMHSETGAAEAIPLRGEVRPATPEELALAPVGSGLEQSNETAAPAAGRKASGNTRRGARQPHSGDNADKKSEARKPGTAATPAETVRSETAHGKTVAGEAVTGEAGKTAEGPETVGRTGRSGTAGDTEKSGTSGSTERSGMPGNAERREVTGDDQKAVADASYEQPGSLRRTGSGTEYEEGAKLGDSANRSDSAERGERPAEAIPLRGEARPDAPEELIHSVPETATSDARSVTSPGHVAMSNETGAAEAIPLRGEVRPDAPEELIHYGPEASSDARSVTRPEHAAMPGDTGAAEAIPLHGEVRPVTPEELALAPVGSGLEQSSETAAPAAGREALGNTRRGTRQPHSGDDVDKKSAARRPGTAATLAETVHGVTAHGKAATGETGRTVEGPETVGRAGRPGTAGGAKKSVNTGSTEKSGTYRSAEGRGVARNIQKAGADTLSEKAGFPGQTGSGAEYEEGAKLGDSAERGERPAEAIPLRGEIRPDAPEELIHYGPEAAPSDVRSGMRPGDAARRAETLARDIVGRRETAEPRRYAPEAGAWERNAPAPVELAQTAGPSAELVGARADTAGAAGSGVTMAGTAPRSGARDTRASRERRWEPGGVPMTLAASQGTDPAGRMATAGGAAYPVGQPIAGGGAPAEVPPVELAYSQSGDSGRNGPSEPETGSAGRTGAEMDSEYVRSLPDWARRFLKEGAGSIGTAPGIAVTGGINTRPVRDMAKKPQMVEWTAPGYNPQPPAETEFKELKPPENQAEQTQQLHISDAEIRRTADRVYKIIEDRIRRERRRLGL